jgi:acyl-coenzyme A synthetase/AMP-(fatty) acid ligase
MLHTGDLFRRDEEGYLYFVARKDDMIKTKGERVSPKEVENVICEIDGVLEAAIVGVPDEMLGQAVKAFVVCNGNQGPTINDIQKRCKEHLEPFMVPKGLSSMTSSRTSNGKNR